ncbi:hypothetical protein [Streptomyces sp. NPDC094049]|uniref:hypothetical protein n=1 Tax=Streptomyces sp. NPDC094049 TaxID=3154987 RepID=UPI00331BB5AB
MNAAAALVTEDDITAAATFLAGGTSFTTLLFDRPRFGHMRCVATQDHAAVGTVLTAGGSMRDRDESQLLAVIRATGRATLQNLPGDPFPAGRVMLGAEVAARYLHQRLTTKRGAYGLAPLTAAIDTLWPLPGVTPHPVHGHPGMNLHRLANKLGPLLSPDEAEAMRLIGRATSDNGINRREHRPRCAARLCTTVIRHRRYDAEALVAVRTAILTARTTGDTRDLETAHGTAPVPATV